jgi:hypothetical protein
MGRSVSAQSASRGASRRGGAWQNKLTLNGRSVSWRVATIIASAWATVAAPSPSEPSAPALLTAAASAGVETPAIGAWIRGSQYQEAKAVNFAWFLVDE